MGFYNRGISATIVAFLFTGMMYAQEINQKALFNVPKGSESDDPPTVSIEQQRSTAVGTKFNMDTPSLFWFIEKALDDTTGVILFQEEELPPADMPDSVYIRRLTAMPSIVSLPYNDIVRNYIVYYMQKYPRHSEKMLGLAEYYLPIFEQILDIYNIPLEMRALPIIESALNPVAVSRAGATGLWQFMLSTGRRYGLTINTYVDERRDPIASTYAAAKYLTTLYSMFQDWTLALAAYNCGEGNVQKAIARAGGSRDYWKIYPYLPRETRNYVPLFVAANYAITYYKEHRLTPKPADIPTFIDTFMVNSKLHFEQISNIVNIPLVQLRELNPQYRRDVIPGNERPYELRIPIEYTNAFIANERSIYGHNISKYHNTDIVVNPTVLTRDKKSSDKNNKPAKPARPTTHEVKTGESLSLIASRYRVKVSDICSWNNLAKDVIIRPGQKLSIYAAAAAARQQTASTNGKPAEVKYHTVEQGDSFWSIAQKYNVDIERLLQINNMTRNSKLLYGKKILVP
jgi:membrane-bound lytic murein transglycosylase D